MKLVKYYTEDGVDEIIMLVEDEADLEVMKIAASALEDDNYNIPKVVKYEVLIWFDEGYVPSLDLNRPYRG